jgi:hypothetical protein
MPQTRVVTPDAASELAGFAVYRPQLIVDALAGHDPAAMQSAFFRSVFSHEVGGRTWQACVDESW